MISSRFPCRTPVAQGLAIALRSSTTFAICLGFSGHLLASPEKAAAYYEDALSRYEKNEMSAAVIQLKNALQQDSKMLAAHLLLGKALLKDGNLKGAEAAFQEALRQGVSRGEVILPLAQINLALGRPEVVIESIHPSGLPPAIQVEVLTLRGNAYLESGKNNLATQSFEKARAIDPTSPLPLIAEVPMLLTAAKVDQAREKANKAIELAPNNANAWSMKAAVLHASFDAPGALAAYEKALSLAPKHVDARIARAALLIDLKRDAEARQDLDYVKAVAEDDPRAAYLRAVLAGQQGDAKATNDALKEVTRTIDTLPPAWLARREQLLMAGALAHFGLGNHGKSREYLDTLISHNPGHMAARKLLASIYVETKDYARAQTVLEALQRSAPDDPQVMFLLGSVNLAQRHYVQAAQYLEKAAGRTGSSEMNRSLGYSQLAQGQAEKGLVSLEKAFAADRGDVQSGMALATLYMRLAKKDKAMKTAEAMIKHDPENLVALNFLGSVKGATGDKAGARAAYTQVLAKDPGFVPSALNLTRLDVGEKRFDEARRRLENLLRNNSNDHQVLYEYGMLEIRADRPSEAVRYLTKAGDVQRNDPNPTLMLINLYLNLRQGDQALSVAKTLSSKYASNLKVQLALARAYLATEDAANARAVLSGATRIAEFDHGYLVAIARMQLAAADPDGAAYSLSKALQGNPGDLPALTLAVQVEARRGDVAKADAALRALTAKHPSAIETLRASADLSMSRGQYAAAVTGYRKILAREENTGNALVLAGAHMAAGETAKAAAFLESWVKAHPTDRRALKALAETQFRAGHLTGAKQSYQRAIAADADDASTLNNYANLLQQLNDPMAQEIAERAYKLSPSAPDYADTLGWILVGKGQIEAGLRYLREARLRSPENGEIRFHLAYTLAKIGRKDEAKEELRAALDSPRRISMNPQVTQLKKDLGM